MFASVSITAALLVIYQKWADTKIFQLCQGTSLKTSQAPFIHVFFLFILILPLEKTLKVPLGKKKKSQLLKSQTIKEVSFLQHKC